MRESLSFVVSGEAGQGLATIEEFLVEGLSKEYHVFSSKEVMSRVRGGNNTFELRVSNQPIHGISHGIDYLFLLNDHSLYRLVKRLKKNTVVFGEESFISEQEKETHSLHVKTLDLTKLAKEAGSRLFANTILFGFISGMLALDKKIGHELIHDRFIEKSEKIVQDNQNAFDVGYQLGSDYDAPKRITKPASMPTLKTMDGNNALGIGLLGGGVNYIASYPMSPGTTILSYLSAKGEEFGVLAEQAEDEIAALNMAIGAWYAGARGMITTSGGGFALMSEALSLAGITESPAVIHIAQRPGPATGLPTRTEQGDLNLAVYAGHGEFARIVLAPGNLEDGISLGQRAFWLADKYQVPVFILTDQYWLESLRLFKPEPLTDKYLETFIHKSERDYKRYELTESGLSKRAIPGHGEGFVKVDSDEHDEYGAITEDFDMRIAMQEKRMKRFDMLLEDYQEAELIGNPDFKQLIVGWGSTYGVCREFIETTDISDVAYLYVKQPYPLSPSLKRYFDQSENTIVIENNFTGQFANLLKLHLDVKVDHKINKYSGEPFFVDEVDTRLKEVLQ